MPDNTSVLKKNFHIILCESGNLIEVEFLEGFTKALSLRQNGSPTQPGLKALQTNFFKQALVVLNREAPFIVMIGDVIGRGRTPAAAEFAVRTFEKLTHELKAPCPTR